MEPHPADESFAHQMHMYQQQHEVHIQHQHQQQQQMIHQQQKSNHNQRVSTVHHHRQPPQQPPSQQQQQLQQHQHQHQHQHQSQQQQQQQPQPQQQQQPLLQPHQHSHISRAQQMLHNLNAPQSGINQHSTRHSINNQQNNNLAQHNQQIRQNRNNLTAQNRPITVNNSTFQQQRFQGNHGPPQMHQQTMLPPTSMQHNHQHVAGSGFQMRQGIPENDFPLRILVQSDMVGAIIGRSGSTIKQITQQTKARIDVHREESLEQHEKVITINGTPESCSAACFKIMEVILYEKFQLDKDGNSSNTFDSQSAKFDYENQEIQLRILAHNNLIGRLIGRNGTSIKKIMEQTSTKINITVNGFTDCTNERTIAVLGNLEQVRLAEQVISAKLRAAYMSDVSVTLQAMNQQPYLFNNVPISYMPGPYAQNPLLSSLVTSQAGHSGSHSMSRAMPVGPHQSSIPGPQLYPSSTSYLSLYPNNPSGQIFGFTPGKGIEVEKETVNIYIPNTMVGAIIGKSGLAIKEMISSSGASIKVAAAPTEPSPSIATLKEENPQSTLQQQADKSEPVDDSTKTNDASENPTQDSSHTPAVVSPLSGPRQHSNAPDNYYTTRKVTIIGTPEAQWSAQYLIYRKVSIENGKSDISLMVEIQVPSQLVGKIIGKGGTTVKQLQKHTRTTIRLPEDRTTSPDNTEKENETCVLITGEFQCSQLAQRHIRNLIRDSLHSANRQNKQPHLNSKQNENASKSDSQPDANENNQNRSDIETTSTPDEHDESESSNEKNTLDNSTHPNGENLTSNESPSFSGELERSSEDKSQSNLSQESSAENEGEQVDDNQTVISNNNTINKNLNSTEKEVTNKQSPINEMDNRSGEDIENNQSCSIENGDEAINSISAKRKTIVDSPGKHPALINNGNTN